MVVFVERPFLVAPSIQIKTFVKTSIWTSINDDCIQRINYSSTSVDRTIEWYGHSVLNNGTSVLTWFYYRMFNAWNALHFAIYESV